MGIFSVIKQIFSITKTTLDITDKVLQETNIVLKDVSKNVKEWSEERKRTEPIRNLAYYLDAHLDSYKSILKFKIESGNNKELYDRLKKLMREMHPDEKQFDSIDEELADKELEIRYYAHQLYGDRIKNKSIDEIREIHSKRNF
ncbi:hypothetical protein [Lonepinella sp. MS14435]|uniref:hypothetical protein n=1 Tax=Lonepinella sp. MS14435 TaxID=3003618 RepID=UPI0036DBF99A